LPVFLSAGKPGNGRFPSELVEVFILRRCHGFYLLALWILATATAVRADATVELLAGIHRIEAEVANTDQLRSAGLSFRSNLGGSQGMVFVFPEVQRHCMWMRDTYIPLSVAFIDEQGAIVNIEDMEPLTDAFHCAERKVRYVLEMNRGWFAQRHIRQGSKILGIETKQIAPLSRIRMNPSAERAS